jgi:hypothetical protein
MNSGTLKLFSLRRDADYDEYDGFVVWARSEREAIEIANSNVNGLAYDDWKVSAVVRPSRPGAVMSSFIRG